MVPFAGMLPFSPFGGTQFVPDSQLCFRIRRAQLCGISSSSVTHIIRVSGQFVRWRGCLPAGEGVTSSSSDNTDVCVRSVLTAQSWREVIETVASVDYESVRRLETLIRAAAVRFAELVCIGISPSNMSDLWQLVALLEQTWLYDALDNSRLRWAVSGDTGLIQCVATCAMELFNDGRYTLPDLVEFFCVFGDLVVKSKRRLVLDKEREFQILQPLLDMMFFKWMDLAKGAQLRGLAGASRLDGISVSACTPFVERTCADDLSALTNGELVLLAEAVSRCKCWAANLPGIVEQLSARAWEFDPQMFGQVLQALQKRPSMNTMPLFSVVDVCLAIHEEELLNDAIRSIAVAFRTNNFVPTAIDLRRVFLRRLPSLPPGVFCDMFALLSKFALVDKDLMEATLQHVKATLSLFQFTDIEYFLHSLTQLALCRHIEGVAECVSLLETQFTCPDRFFWLREFNACLIASVFFSLVYLNRTGPHVQKIGCELLTRFLELSLENQVKFFTSLSFHKNSLGFTNLLCKFVSTMGTKVTIPTPHYAAKVCFAFWKLRIYDQLWLGEAARVFANHLRYTMSHGALNISDDKRSDLVQTVLALSELRFPCIDLFQTVHDLLNMNSSAIGNIFSKKQLVCLVWSLATYNLCPISALIGFMDWSLSTVNSLKKVDLQKLCMLAVFIEHEFSIQLLKPELLHQLAKASFASTNHTVGNSIEGLVDPGNVRWNMRTAEGFVIDFALLATPGQFVAWPDGFLANPSHVDVWKLRKLGHRPVALRVLDERNFYKRGTGTLGHAAFVRQCLRFCGWYVITLKAKALSASSSRYIASSLRKAVQY